MLKVGSLIQGAGHIIFADGVKCTMYVDDEDNYYATAELIPIEKMVELHGEYELN